MKNKEPKKIGRIGYVFTIIFLMIFVFIFFAVIGFVFNNEDLMGLAILFLLAVTFTFLFKVTRNRLNDINLPKGLSFVLLVPTINVFFMMVLCFLPSDLISGDTVRNKNNRNRKMNKVSRPYHKSDKRPENYKRTKPIQPRRQDELHIPNTNENPRTQTGLKPSLDSIIEQIHKEPSRKIGKVQTAIEHETALTSISSKTIYEKKAIPVTETLPNIKPKKQKAVIKVNTNMNTISLIDFMNITGIESERAAQILKERDKAGRLISAYDLSLRLDITPEERKKIETQLEFRL